MEFSKIVLKLPWNVCRRFPHQNLQWHSRWSGSRILPLLQLRSPNPCPNHHWSLFFKFSKRVQEATHKYLPIAEKLKPRACKTCLQIRRLDSRHSGGRHRPHFRQACSSQLWRLCRACSRLCLFRCTWSLSTPSDWTCLHLYNIARRHSRTFWLHFQKMILVLYENHQC